MKQNIQVSVFNDALNINDQVLYNKESIFGRKLTLKEAVESRKTYLEKIKVECDNTKLKIKVKSLEQQIDELNIFIPDDKVKEEIKTIGLEHLNQHKEDLERSIRLGYSLIEEALSDYNSYVARYDAAKSFLEQYYIIE